MKLCKWFGHKYILVDYLEVPGMFGQGGVRSRYRCKRCGREESSQTETLRMSGSVDDIAKVVAEAVCTIMKEPTKARISISNNGLQAQEERRWKGNM